jgi:hypothetical protein
VHLELNELERTHLKNLAIREYTKLLFFSTKKRELGTHIWWGEKTQKKKKNEKILQFIYSWVYLLETKREKKGAKQREKKNPIMSPKFA